jgi:hypothetical protein
VATTAEGFTLIDGSLVATTTPQPLATDLPCRHLTLMNKADSGNDILVGDAESQSMQLAPGDSEDFSPLGNANQVWVTAVAGTATVTYHAIAIT